MDETLTFSYAKLSTFLICQRRFQLRCRQRLPWPAPPLDGRAEQARTRGEQFHRLLQRHFLQLPVDEQAIEDADLRRWWRLFQNSGLALPDGRFLPEISLTVPIGDHFLSGRFDLLIAGKNSKGIPYTHIFDWKTGKALTEAQLRQEWQTRLYLAILAEGGEALLEGHAPPPNQVAITYWYVTDPGAPRTIRYSQAQHAQNWTEIQALVAQIEQQLVTGKWPLTDDWSHCRRCAYQVYCGRQAAGREEVLFDEDEEMEEVGLQLDPDSP